MMSPSDIDRVSLFMIKKLLPDFEEFQKKRIGTELFQINTLHCAKNEVFHSGFIQQI